MFLKRLRLVDTVATKTLRTVNFCKGANLVVDAESSDRHNKVGKTTFLGLLDIAMGAQHRKRLYTDRNGAIDKKLQDLIESKRIAVELKMSDRVQDYELSVDLFKGGHYRINGEQVSQSAYRAELNSLLFRNESDVPKFRELILAFVRVSVGRDKEPSLRFLDSYTSNAKYQSIYGYLFGMADPVTARQSAELVAERSKLEDAMRKYTEMVGYSDSSVVDQIIGRLEKEKNRTELKLNDVLDPQEFKKNRDSIIEARDQFTKLTFELGEVEYRERILNGDLQNARKDMNLSVGDQLTAAFFAEVSEILPDVQKTYEELVRFNEALAQNKILYLEESLRVLAEGAADKRAAIERLTRSSGTKFALLEGETLDDYTQLLNELGEIEQQVGSMREVRQTLDHFARREADIDREITKISNTPQVVERTPLEAMDTFNDFFTPLAESINNEKPILTYVSDASKFPVKFEQLDGSSTGTRKSLMAAYDLAYQEFALTENIHVPRFVVHDVIETVEGEDFKAILEAADASDTQFVVAVLREKLDSSMVPVDYQDKHTIIRLSMTDRLFEGPSEQ